REWSHQLPNPKGVDSWQQKDFTFENPGAGTFILQAESKGVIRTKMFFVTAIAAVLKRDSGKAIVYVANRRTGAALEGAEVTIPAKNSKDVVKAFTGRDGVARLAVSSLTTGEPTVIVRWRKNPTAINMYWYGGGDYDKYKVYLYTDRPVYRPKQTVKFRGAVRIKGDKEYSLPDAKEVNILIRDPQGNEVFKGKSPLSEFGTYSGEYGTGEEPPLGGYSIITTVNGNDYYSSFSVEEYRKPEYIVKVNPEKNVSVRGDELRFNIKATYYFGEPVKAAKVSYLIYRRPLWRYWYWRPYSWYYDDEGPRGRSYYGGYGEQVASGGGETDAKGEMRVVFADTKYDGDVEYTLVANVMEKGRREITGEGSARFMKGEFTIDLSTDRYMVKPGEKAVITMNIKDLEELPLSRSANLIVELIEWNKGNQKRKMVFEKTVETASDGSARIDFTPDEPGYYSISAGAADKRGNKVSGSTSLYVASESGYYNYYSQGGLEIILDKDSYKPGDEAHILINSGLGDAQALVTVEADSIINARVVNLVNGSAYINVKVTREFQPNADISVTVIKNNQLNQAGKTIVSPPDDKFLDVTVISDKEIYKPGETAHVSVVAKDSEGKPAGAELSLGAVDESIYAVKPESTQDVRSFFYGRRYNRVVTQSSFWFYSYGDDGVMLEKSAAAPTAMLAGGARKMKDEAAPNQAALVQPAIRSDFPDTAYWRANIVTGEDGKADVTFTMPDTLTTWRLTSRGITRDTKVGEVVKSVISKKNVIVRLETPRFFTQDDRTTITAVIHNYLATDKKVVAELNVKGIKLLEGNTKNVVVPSGGDVRVEWSGMVESPQTAWVTVKALTDEESDAMQLSVPVLPHGAPGGDSAAGDADEAPASFDLVLPPATVKDTQKLVINIAPSLTSSMF
ncbi:MAG TPA: MG2 domain-containing protein, partial [bacterium]|nr:MG2 domain-containing protein [bacterium]